MSPAMRQRPATCRQSLAVHDAMHTNAYELRLTVTTGRRSLCVVLEKHPSPIPAWSCFTQNRPVIRSSGVETV